MNTAADRIALIEQRYAVGISNYVNTLVHRWSESLTALGFILIPLFFILDLFMMPPEFFTRFALYRFVTTLVVFIQYFVIHLTKPARHSRAHGYFFSTVAGLMIVIMTRDLGGFDSSYYAGLNLVLIATNLLLPWEVIHSIINSALIIGMYVVINAIWGGDFEVANLVNNLYFMSATAVIAVSINYVKQKLVRQEFLLRAELEEARDALWTEMEVAKRIQTALLPNERRIGPYEVAALMVPADEVGGDYYDIIETRAGETWVAIGDVSGHGVESGLIMMMAQTSIYATVNKGPGTSPASVLTNVNSVIKENISRLGTDRYMTVSAVRLEHDGFTFAGKHQDIYVHRTGRGATEFVPSKGTWLGVIDDIGDYLQDTQVNVNPDDVILLFTDGVTEATNEAGQMFGEHALERALAQSARMSPADIVLSISSAVADHMSEQRDDYTIIVLKRRSKHGSAGY